MGEQIEFQSKSLQHEPAGNGVTINGKLQGFLALADDAMAIGRFLYRGYHALPENMFTYLRCAEWLSLHAARLPQAKVRAKSRCYGFWHPRLTVRFWRIPFVAEPELNQVLGHAHTWRRLSARPILLE